MSQIIYENDEAVFTFNYQDIYKKLSLTIKKTHFHDIFMLFKWLQDNSNRGEQDIKINAHNLYRDGEYLNHIVYLIRDLFADQKGIIYCKKCMHNIPPSKIRKDQTPAIQAVNNQIIERLRGKSGFHKSVEFSNIGRTKFLCNKKHELFGIIDWQ